MSFFLSSRRAGGSFSFSCGSDVGPRRSVGAALLSVRGADPRHDPGPISGAFRCRSCRRSGPSSVAVPAR
jgi:hypothetical protein